MPQLDLPIPARRPEARAPRPASRPALPWSTVPRLTRATPGDPRRQALDLSGQIDAVLRAPAAGAEAALRRFLALVQRSNLASFAPAMTQLEAFLAVPLAREKRERCEEMQFYLVSWREIKARCEAEAG